MHIMLVNDDGIFAPGIRTLARIAAEAGHRVSVCAPDSERSAASHQITLHASLPVRETEMEGAERAVAAGGTPADCASLGLYLFSDVDLVLSGINNGSNMGGACVYSGTVGAAIEASMAGKPALAVSLCGFDVHRYEASARIAVGMADWVLRHPLPRGAAYNLNVPVLPLEEIRGVRAARLAGTYLTSPAWVRFETPEGVRYGYEHVEVPETGLAPDSDVVLARQGYAVLTAVTFDIRLPGPDPDLSDLEVPTL
ncbi:MAG: 5'/3'-nucleotidase SurE [Clostridia bacterium]|nr:5'/3'-nucleotidase SurE [Clostridia bacterium]